jgi:hypothetical protein
MTQEQKAKIEELTKRMRAVAAPVGPMHSWWDVIFDMEAFVKGEKTIVIMTADKWIEYAEHLLSLVPPND